MIGAKTIGNATLIVFDDKPVLATDPWLGGNGAYFGSWQLSHQIPARELEEILSCQYIWFSHGHPDHMNAESIEFFRNATILLPDHVGGRIYHDLQSQGFTIRILPEREWVQLSKHVRICCISDYNQDALLLVDVNGHLFVNLNDGSARGWEGFVRSIAKQFKHSYLLRLSGYGDADMINFFDEDGGLIKPYSMKKSNVGAAVVNYADRYGVTHVIPFSSFHKYQRSDSQWANAYTTPLDAYSYGFKSSKAKFLPPFLEINCVSSETHEIHPPETEDRIIPAEEFGDNWSDLLERDDVHKVERYFLEKEALRDHFGFINLRVGGTDNHIVLNKKVKTGITFEVPRNSLIAAIEYEVFDDLLIGNFMKTTLHAVKSLYPNFTPVVGKYADNGRAKTKDELKAYMDHYRKRAPLGFLLHVLEEQSRLRFRQFFSRDSMMWNFSKRSYILLKRMSPN